MRRCGCWKDMGPGLAKGESVVCQEFWLSASFVPEVTLVGKISRLLLGPQHPMSICPPDSFTQATQQHHSSEDTKLWSPVHSSPPGFFITMKGLTSLQCPKSHGHLVPSFFSRVPSSVNSSVFVVLILTPISNVIDWVRK